MAWLPVAQTRPVEVLTASLSELYNSAIAGGAIEKSVTPDAGPIEHNSFSAAALLRAIPFSHPAGPARNDLNRRYGD